MPLATVSGSRTAQVRRASTASDGPGRRVRRRRSAQGARRIADKPQRTGVPAERRWSVTAGVSLQREENAFGGPQLQAAAHPLAEMGTIEVRPLWGKG